MNDTRRRCLKQTEVTTLPKKSHEDSASMKPPHPEKYSFIPNCRATPSVFFHLLAERDYNYTLCSRKIITSQEKTLSQPLDNIFSDLDRGFFIYRIIKNT